MVLVRKPWDLDCLSQLGLRNKTPQTGGLEQHTVASPSSGDWDVQIKVLVGFVPSENSLPGLHLSTFLSRPHMAFPQCAHGERERELALVSSSCKNTNPFMETPTS